jgi:dihydrofolate reductase
VITRNRDFEAENITVVASINEGLQIAKSNHENEAFILGGGQIYQQVMSMVDRLYITQIDAEFDGDTLFPKIEDGLWELTSEVKHKPDEWNKFHYAFQIYERVTS